MRRGRGRWIAGVALVALLVLGGLAYYYLSGKEKEPDLKADVPDELDIEARQSFDYLWEQSNHEEGSAGYGLARDRYPGNPSIASTAATGFALTAIPIGVEKGWITREEGYERADRTLDTLLNMEHEHGFFYHFVNMNTGKREWNSEISSVDTGLLMNGVLTAGQYFSGDVRKKSEQLYERVEWPWFVDKSNNQFYMAYFPDKKFEGHWDFYAEQLSLYVLAAGSPTHPIDNYASFKRHKAPYKDSEPFIHSWFGSIFTYQFSHAWVDFRGLTDRYGIDWHHNSVVASEASRQFAIDQSGKFKSLHANSWGLSAADTPKGYNGLLGSPPSGFDNQAHQVDGTVPTAGAIASVVFTSDASVDALKYYLTIPDLSGKYGLKNAFNLDADWVDPDYIGIDKGIALLMASNYRDDTVWNIFMEVPYVKQGLDNLGFTKKENSSQ